MPELRIHEVQTDSEPIECENGQVRLFAGVAQTLEERRAARRCSLGDRVQIAADIANETDEQVLIWCGLNDEGDALTKSINGAVQVAGSDTMKHKEDTMLGFSAGSVRALVSKAKIAGWGMNWQNCHKVIFVGLSDSFEEYYQAVRRCWRFGQDKPVDVYIIISDAEGAVRANIERKQKDAERMKEELVKHTRDILSADIHKTVKISDSYKTNMRMEIPSWLKSVM